MQTMTNKEPKEEYKVDLEWKRKVHNVRMAERLYEEKEFSRQMFKETLEQLKKKGDKFKFILKAGKSLHEALFKLYEVVWNKEKIPDTWRETIVIPLDKGKADKNLLSNKRFIHTKKEIPKAFGHIVTNSLNQQ